MSQGRTSYYLADVEITYDILALTRSAQCTASENRVDVSSHTRELNKHICQTIKKTPVVVSFIWHSQIANYN